MAILGTKNAINSSSEIWGSGGYANFPITNLASSFDKLYKASGTLEKNIFVNFANSNPIRVVYMNDHNASQTAIWDGFAYGPNIFEHDEAGFTSGNFTIVDTEGSSSLDTTAITLSADWEGTITPKFTGFPFDASKTYLIYVKYTGSVAGWEGLSGETATDLVTGGTIERIVHGSHGIASTTGLNGTITKVWVKELEYSVSSQKMLGPLEIWDGREWGVFPWGGIVPESEITWPKNTPWVFDRARQINAIRIVMAGDPDNAKGYFQMRNLHASYALEVGSRTRQQSEGKLTYPDRASSDLSGLGKIKQNEIGLPYVVSPANPRRRAGLPIDQIEQHEYHSNLMHVHGQSGDTSPVPYIYSPYTNDFGLRQATTFYGYPKNKLNARLGPGLRVSGPSVEITEARL